VEKPNKIQKTFFKESTRGEVIFYILFSPSENLRV
jgi:hypothetical protein